MKDVQFLFVYSNLTIATTINKVGGKAGVSESQNIQTRNISWKSTARKETKKQYLI